MSVSTHTTSPIALTRPRTERVGAEPVRGSVAEPVGAEPVGAEPVRNEPVSQPRVRMRLPRPGIARRALWFVAFVWALAPLVLGSLLGPTLLLLLPIFVPTAALTLAGLGQLLDESDRAARD